MLLINLDGFVKCCYCLKFNSITGACIFLAFHVLLNFCSWPLQTVCVWQSSENGNYDCRHTLKDHSAEVLHLFISFIDTESYDVVWLFKYFNKVLLVILIWRIKMDYVKPSFAWALKLRMHFVVDCIDIRAPP